MRVAVVPAAGLGRRFGGKKQFFKLKGKLIVEYPLSLFEKSELISAVILVLPKENLELGEELRRKFSKLYAVVPGGEERQSSVKKGLEAAKELSPSEVVVHDGVRPIVPPTLLRELIIALADYDVDGVIPGVKPKETVKEIGSPLEPGDHFVKRTLNRDNLILVQTPQVFSFRTLLECHIRAEKEEFTATDDSALLERYGYSVVSIPGDYRNIKITTPEDVKIAEVFLSSPIL
ncbi:MAG: 2-C-methyl-D-erythritol 4-phosphate cytidylyltransferase [Desulfurobacteriaceae bacterium]